MIAYLKGQLQKVTGQSAILLVGGVGYEVLLTPQATVQLLPGDEVELYIAEHIKEDQYSLFGFQTAAERTLYYQLTSVSGVGPKAAMAIISAHEVTEIEAAITSGDIALFAGVSGVGKKTAQRVILELKGKLDVEQIGKSMAADPVHQALLGLGFAPKQADEMMRDLPAELSTEEKIKQALRGVKK